jgi:hypothetical protein
MRKLTQLAIAGSTSLLVAAVSALPGIAQLRNHYTLQQAESGAVSIHVWPGSGTNLDFTRSGEFIYRAWLDDPSRVQFDTDTPIENANAQIIHLRKIEAIDVEGLPATGTTLLSVATVDASGQRHLYQFTVLYGGGTPDYSTIVLSSPQATTVSARSAYGGVGLQTFRDGIAQLILDGTIEGNGPMHERLKTFINLVQAGSTPADAAQSVGVDLAVIQEVARIGSSAAAEESRTRLDGPAEPLAVPDAEVPIIEVLEEPSGEE